MNRYSLRKPGKGAFEQFRRRGIQTMEQRALVQTDRAAQTSLTGIRSAMAGAGLGKLGNALGAGSDLRKTGRVERFGANGFRVSGWVHIRSRSERALGAIEAYTEGAEIRPVKGRWMWMATDDIPARVGRYLMTPERYRDSGLEQRIGPLFEIKSINGNPLLAVKNVGVNAAGKSRSAKSLRKNGQARKGQRAREFLVAFVGIPRTSRAARVRPRPIIEAQARRAGAAIIEES